MGTGERFARRDEGTVANGRKGEEGRVVGGELEPAARHPYNIPHGKKHDKGGRAGVLK